MSGYREGVPEAKSPCRTPESEAVGWIGCKTIKIQKFTGVRIDYVCHIVWHKYFKDARDILAQKLGVCPSHLNVKPIRSPLCG